MMSTLRFTLRTLGRSPAFAAAIVGILALGLGATTAVTSIVDTVLVKPLPFADPQRLSVVWEHRPQVGGDEYLVTPADFFYWREHAQGFSGLSAYTEAFFNLASDTFPLRLKGLIATPNLLDTLGVAPMIGRRFTDDDAVTGAPDVVIVSYNLWRQELGGAPLEGLTLDLDGTVATVVGVLPADFVFLGKSIDLLAVYAPTPEGAANRLAHFLTVVGRLAPGVSFERAEDEMEGLARQLAETFPETNAGHSARVVPLRDELVGSVRPALVLLLLAVGCVLLITCANVANLLLARGATRSGEMAVRASLGASRGRLVRQLLGEGLVLGVLGGVVGLAVAWLGVHGLRALTPVDVPRLDRLAFDWRLYGFALLLSLVIGLVVSLLPALTGSRAALVGSLAAAGRSQGRPAAGRWLRTVLVSAEVTLSVMLLIGAGLLLRSFSAVLAEDPGFTTEHLVTVDLSVPWARLSDGDDPGAFLHRLLERLRQEPSIESIGATSHLPMSGEDGSRSFTITGRESASPEEALVAEYRRISVGYSETLGIPLLRGRTFTAFDSELPGVALVNHTFAERYFPGGEALGQSLLISDGADDVPREIVGVLGDVRHFGLHERPRPEIYVPMLQRPWPAMSLVISTKGSPETAVKTVRETLRQMDPGLPVANVRTIEEAVGRSVATERFSAFVVALFAFLATVLAAFGIYGVQSFFTQQMRREIGIRIALGAGSGEILRRILGRGILPVAVGLGLGLALAAGFGRLLENQLYGVRAQDPWTFILVPLLLGAVALAACYLPARRALRIDPGRLFSE